MFCSDKVVQERSCLGCQVPSLPATRTALAAKTREQFMTFKSAWHVRDYQSELSAVCFSHKTIHLHSWSAGVTVPESCLGSIGSIKQTDLCGFRPSQSSSTDLVLPRLEQSLGHFPNPHPHDGKPCDWVLSWMPIWWVASVSFLFVHFINLLYMPICFSVVFPYPSSDTTGVDVGKFRKSELMLIRGKDLGHFLWFNLVPKVQNRIHKRFCASEWLVQVGSFSVKP